MIYQAYEAWSDAAGPLRVLAGLTAPWLRLSALGPMTPPWWPHVAAALELVARTGLTHRRPPFGIDRVRVADRDVAVHEEIVDASPFATLRRFRKAHEAPQPRVLLVAPMSGHFPTLLRGTVRTMLPEHDVYLTDWHNARDVEVAHGAFGLDEFIDHVMRFLRALGPGAHVVAVCQPCVAVLAAVALMAEDGDPATPRTLTLMAGPVDTRVNPTRVNALATGRSLAWFRRHLIGHVPWRYRGARRLVYPGFVQLAAFMSMNLGRHVRAHADLYRHLARRRREGAGDAGVLRRVLRGDGPAGGVLPRHRAAGLPGAPAAAGDARVARASRRPGRDPRHDALHGRGRKGRHLCGRADRRRPRPVHRTASGPPAPPRAGRGRPLRSLRRVPLGTRDLSTTSGRHPHGS
jgi:poly(3-hydroxybutyrate) depolymerase